MAKVYVCMLDCTYDAHTECAWSYTTIDKIFSNEESAKNWIDELRMAHHNGNDGATHQEDIGERWVKGEVYAREYIDIDGRTYQEEFHIQGHEVVD